MLKSERNKILSSFRFPLGFVFICFIVFVLDLTFDLHLSRWGVFPRTVAGLKGLLFWPFLHGSWEHLFNNSIPMLILGWALFYFYRPIAYKTLLWIFVMSGLWLWISGRQSYHIGASGIIYGLTVFLFFSGIFRREKKVSALSLLVIFLYGSMWWGILPVKEGVSWEGHLWGGFAGLVLALVFRKQGPQKPKYQWEIDEIVEEELMKEQQKFNSTNAVDIEYEFIPTPKKKDEL